MLFLGAGASKPLSVPTMEEFTDVVLKDLGERVNLEPLVRGIQKQIAAFGLKPDIEAVLTVLEAKTQPKKALADIGPSVILFAEQYRNLAEDTLAKIAITEIEEAIYKRCMQINHELAVKLYGNLWDEIRKNLNIPIQGGSEHIGQAALNRIFTTNYDLSVETFFKRRHYGYDEGYHEDPLGDSAFDGRWGERGGILLFKLHGSINYYVKSDGKIVRSTTPLQTENLYGEQVVGPRMIYPTGEKYATRSPFYEYLGQLRSALAEERVCVVVGYSFRDVPITNAFLDGIQKNSRLRILLVGPSANLIHSGLDENLRKRARPLPGKFGEDTLPKQIVETFRAGELWSDK